MHIFLALGSSVSLINACIPELAITDSSIQNRHTEKIAFRALMGNVKKLDSESTPEQVDQVKREIDLFLQAGNSINQHDDYGKTLLLNAAQTKHSGVNCDIARYLLEAKADCNSMTANSWTVVHELAAQTHPSALALLKILLKKGVDFQVDNGRGRTPQGIARFFQNHIAIGLMEKEQARRKKRAKQ